MPLPEGVSIDHDLDGVKITLSPPPRGWLRLTTLLTRLAASLLASALACLLLAVSIAEAIGADLDPGLAALASALAGLVITVVAFVRQLSRVWLVGPRVVLVLPAAVVVNSIRIRWPEIARINDDASIVLRDGETVAVASVGDDAALSWLADQLRLARDSARRGEPSEVPAALRALRSTKSLP